MNSIIISSTIRKAFCCVILLGLFFSTLGAGNLPAAQALISQSPAGATLHGSLSSESKLESQARTVLASNCNGGFSAGQINSYIQCEFGNSPLIGYGATFVSDGQTYNVDPRFVVAISAAESSFGTNGNCATQYHNAWGYGGGWPSCWKFSSWQAAIQQVTADIGTYYLPKGQDTIASFVITPAGTCTTHCWCASGCTSWVAIVQQVYKALGGNPNTNNLSYTGNSGGGGGGVHLRLHRVRIRRMGQPWGEQLPSPFIGVRMEPPAISVSRAALAPTSIKMASVVPASLLDSNGPVLINGTSLHIIAMAQQRDQLGISMFNPMRRQT